MAEQGRLKDAEEKFIEQTLPGIDYLAHYPGTIVSQSGQTFDFQPDSDRVPGLQGLTLNTGPGVEVTIDPLASPRATLFFANGDPGLPQLALGDTPGLLNYQISSERQIAFTNDAFVVLNPDGSVTITSPDQLQTIKVDASGHTIAITGDAGVSISATGNIQIQSAGGGVLLGGATDQMVRGSAFLANLLILFNAWAGLMPTFQPDLNAFEALVADYLSLFNFTD